tara:strand:+ start:875 stop:1090 length:216 start_codon:yes stop_codon:yes gene_type:complete
VSLEIQKLIDTGIMKETPYNEWYELLIRYDELPSEIKVQIQGMSTFTPWKHGLQRVFISFTCSEETPFSFI